MSIPDFFFITSVISFFVCVRACHDMDKQLPLSLGGKEGKKCGQKRDRQRETGGVARSLGKGVKEIKDEGKKGYENIGQGDLGGKNCCREIISRGKQQ